MVRVESEPDKKQNLSSWCDRTEGWGFEGTKFSVKGEAEEKMEKSPKSKLQWDQV